MDYNFDKDISGAHYSVEIDTAAQYGCFENKRHGGGGGLWFEGLKLVDYDGVFELPAEVIEQLRANGFAVDETFE